MIKKILVILLMIVSVGAYCQMLNPTKWEIKSSKSQVKVGETVDIILTATIDKEWHFYALGEEPPYGSITFDGTGFEPVGKIKEGAGIKEKYDENLEMKVRYYENKAEFRQTVKILKANPSITAEVEGQACPNGPGQCVRVNKTLEIKNIKVTAASEGSKSLNDKESGSVKSSTEGVSAKGQKEAGDQNQTRLNQLEAEKKKLITKDSQGNDETVFYLKDFINKYGK